MIPALTRPFASSGPHSRVVQPRENAGQQPGELTTTHGDQPGVASGESPQQEPRRTHEITGGTARDEAITTPQPRAVEGAVTACVSPVEGRQIRRLKAREVTDSDRGSRRC